MSDNLYPNYRRSSFLVASTPNPEQILQQKIGKFAQTLDHT